MEIVIFIGYRLVNNDGNDDGETWLGGRSDGPYDIMRIYQKDKGGNEGIR